MTRATKTSHKHPHDEQDETVERVIKLSLHPLKLAKDVGDSLQDRFGIALSRDQVEASLLRLNDAARITFYAGKGWWMPGVVFPTENGPVAVSLIPPPMVLPPEPDFKPLPILHTSAPRPPVSERVEVPEGLLPPTVELEMELEETQTPASPLDIMFYSKQLEVLGQEVGFELGPYNPEVSSARVRDCWRRALNSFLEAGAHLARVRAVMGPKPFWAWFEEQDFPFGRVWAKSSIHAIQQLEGDPELRKITRKLSAAKHFQVVSKALSAPDAREEWDQEGTILGKTPDELDKLSHKDIEKLYKQVKDMKEALADTQMKADKLASQNKQLEAAVEERGKEAAELRTKVVALKFPDVAAGDKTLEADFTKELVVVNELVLRMAMLRPLGRKDTDGFSPAMVVRFWTSMLAVERQAQLIMREIELKWQDQLPELLLNIDGDPLKPMDRVGYRFVVERADNAVSALQAYPVGVPANSTTHPPTIVNREGVILVEGGE